jgi:integrase
MTGMRRGEALGLRWDDLDPQKSTLEIKQTVVLVNKEKRIGKPKTESSIRTIHLPQLLVGLLLDYKATQKENPHNLIFTGLSGGPVHPQSLRLTFIRLCKKAAVRQIRIHDLRHAYITRAIEAGIPVKVVSEAVGHGKVTTTMGVYQHISPQQHQQLADKMAEIMYQEE